MTSERFLYKASLFCHNKSRFWLEILSFALMYKIFVAAATTGALAVPGPQIDQSTQTLVNTEKATETVLYAVMC